MVKQARYMAKQRFAGMWGHGCLGLLWRHNYEVVGSNNRSILYLGKQAESYKVMIYAPPCLEEEVGAEGEDDRKASPPREIRGSTRERNTGKQSTEMHSITMEQAQAGTSKHRQSWQV